MQKNVDILVIGGSAAGIVAATTARAFYPDKQVLIVRKEERAVVPCGIPYIYGTLEGIDQNIIPAAHIEQAGVELMIDEVVSISKDEKNARTASGTVISYDKLVIATGSVPKVPGWLSGTELDGVYTIPKDCSYLDHLRDKLETCRKVVIIGAGFIGVEIADELSKKQLDITLVEVLPHVLQTAFDHELSEKAEDILASAGVSLKLGCKVEEIEGDDGAVSGVRLAGGERLDADAVILATGYLPNTTLAADAGIKLNELGAIRVDEYMRTEDKDVFAVGDCAEKFSFFTRIVKGLMLASTACSEARIAGMNLYKLSRLRTFGGTMSIFSTAIGGTTFAAAGVTEHVAVERGFDIVTGSAEGIDKHPKTLPGVHQQWVKLIVNRESGLVLGGSVIGGTSAGELINVIGVIIENMMTIHEVLTLQFGTHPLLTGPPTGYPLLKAAENVAKQLRK
ncbi:FAD-dependent oxidoreductase [Prosthecochloris sp. N3]|uniref:FAD-dependent oxidoreductase n=1 Tax=Prosthecochloris ethylica TaxID=2743976 RepID=A0ABR9XUV3_9CHLB|nr:MULTISPECIES: FAD-dependent oxidoreductase [Prosthecochloris]MEC9487782.1 FAD-dependent oxidoreductase [Prosthecochloris sp.]MBF0586451.1 FAD-dependent oxidoreductase [Prosthecochloris ethylica]MBF0637570.1 FAD-dependent oxidoreductase [Prosthecochloris ethylica]NUK47505.1 FAD-dependent oxidoreductase [Prosthecochloris ethylica]RNA64245.1 pyridine nucleotide-disulfide oxidoreductase [Prosthecochloris sp. ZM_2]